MSVWFQAIAVDFDGTLTAGSRPAPAVLDALAETRSDGRRVVLVTGRILAELRHVFADVENHFDAIVTENGAVLDGSLGHRILAEPVDPQLEDSLMRRGVPVRGGQALLACDAVHSQEVLEEINRLGLDCQLLTNRAALMVLPAGVTKGSGATAALAELGLSPHNAIGVGDAENDLALLRSCELGVAVSNAVTIVKKHADLVLDEPDGAGVVSLLRGPVLTGAELARSERRSVQIGRCDDGSSAALCATESNVVIMGGSGSGKSFLGGMFAERLIRDGYSLLVIDVEGDHIGLGELDGVLVVSGDVQLPSADDLCGLFHLRHTSVVLDVSGIDPDRRDSYLSLLAAAVRDRRRTFGVPHWVIADEAHLLFGGDGAWADAVGGRRFCLLTWRPDLLGAGVARATDATVILPGLGSSDPAVLETLDRWGLEPAKALVADLDIGKGVLAPAGGPPFIFSLDDRRTGHVRHWHKYMNGTLPPMPHFHFRRSPNDLIDRVATNLDDFHRILCAADDDVIRHHVRSHDFSRWVIQALQDTELGADFARIEDGHVAKTQLGRTRTRLVSAIERRYMGADSDAHGL